MNDALLDSRGGQLLVGLAAGAAGLAGSYAATGYTPTFVASPIERTLSRTMPGEVVTFAITYLGSLGQQLNLATALALTWLLFAAGAAGGFLGAVSVVVRVVDPELPRFLLVGEEPRLVTATALDHELRPLLTAHTSVVARHALNP